MGWSGLREVERAWRELARRHDVTPFQRPEWAEAWLLGAPQQVEPWIVAVGDPVEALLPLFLDRTKGLRRLRLLGIGVADYMGVIPPSVPDGVIQAIGTCLRSHASRFDIVDLQGLYCSPKDLDLLAAALPGVSFSRPYERCPIIDTDRDWASFLAGRSKKFRANLKRATRRAESFGRTHCGVERASSELFDEMISVERDSWKWKGGFAYLRETRSREFLRRILLGSNLESEVWTCRIDHVLASFAVVFPSAGVRYYYLPSFRTRFPDTGAFLLAQIVRDSCESDIREVDLLQGDEPYKAAWASKFRVVHQLVGGGIGIRGRLVAAGYRARWQLAGSAQLRGWRQRVLVWLRRFRTDR